MTRQEFIEELRIALQGNMNQSQVNGHLNYYDNYIMEQARKGRTEQQVIENLGNPRLIAKTLIDTSGEKRTYYEEPEHPQNHQEKKWKFDFGRAGWLWKIGIVLIAIIALVLLGHVLVFLLPIIMVAVLIFFIVSWISGNKR